ncbi:TSUP family transporter [Candidatus Zixiibacteriota bacterium]
MSFFTGIIASLVGIGGGVILVPVLYLIVGLPLTTSRGTTSLMIGFSAAAAAVVYLLNDQLDYKIASGVILGIMLGGKLGGYLGTMAKPLIVKIVFFILMLYLAFKLAYQSLEAIL